LTRHDPVSIPFDFAGMRTKTQKMLRSSLDALVNLNTDIARQVCVADSEVDAINRQMYGQVQEQILKQPDKIESLIRLLSVSRQLERIADYATNISEDVIYMIEGKIIRHRAEINERFKDSEEDE